MARLFAWLASFRLRTLFRAIFLLLAGATLALALAVLREEKQQSFDNYRDSFAKTRDQIAARLRHPTGQLALLNPQSSGQQVTPLRPLLLPYAALDVDEQNKVRNAVDMAGCAVHYPNDASLCVAVGSNPWAGAFVYAAGRFASSTLVPHEHGDRYLTGAHRLRIQLSLRGQDYRWLAPVELEGGGTAQPGKLLRGRLTGFTEIPDGDYVFTRPQREFRGWIWQSAACLPGRTVAPDCEREVFYAIRLPVELLREELMDKRRPVWPPADMNDIRVQLQVFAPQADKPMFDSNSADARAPFLLADLQSLLLPGETLRIRKAGDDHAPDLLHMLGEEASSEPISPLLLGLIRRLPVDSSAFPLETREEIATPVGRFELILTGDARSANRILARAATRVAWFVAAMLGAIFLAWFAIELGIIRRIAVLTRRAQSVHKSISASEGLEQLNVADLRSGDELGILASCLHELLRRVREDMAREQIRAAQERDMWHAVGHEIMSPLQSLLALHPGSSDPEQRYLARMQQAVRVLYGAASPSEAFEVSQLQVASVDLDAFLQAVAHNAPGVGITDVHYTPAAKPIAVRADEFALEDVVTHVLNNAQRLRTPGSPISLGLESGETSVRVCIRNQGPQIAAEMLEKIFEYGVSDQAEAGAAGSRGQGLFVARTYMAKMGGTISARNTADGVEFVLELQRS
ncbi:HAMP domain-containing sensor histidine kinase [Uliginosibacterium sp. 31-16]|uniref:sensor histidine kinase n=1 Tax=Uliginosibacterium sp. 31-16 TaxID=3068315 RepID=UPI00273F186C|nr:HAMP domain-containing sensor histidine kinase [Uliginosibacterium sp. 31-16]MDP5238194.1 HAMP domain-containing sensor histidine kinase [Uliginosibacterium sp. 31-16]